VPKLRVLVAAFTLLAGCSSAPPGDDGSGSVGESQDHLLAGRRVSESEVASLLRDAGFPESSIGQMICTAKYESSFYERASHVNNNGTTDYGLFQINSIHLRDAGCPSTTTGMYDAAQNTKCALRVYRSQGIRAWYGYQKHKTECDAYRAPGAAVGADDPNQPVTPPPSSSPPPPADDGAGACWSGTLEDMVDGNGCVQSQYDGVWYQCHDGQWYGGTDASRGPYGACTSSHPLD
jgi:hypothetical protein